MHVTGTPSSETAVAPSGEHGAPNRTPALVGGGLVGAGEAEIGGATDVDVVADNTSAAVPFPRDVTTCDVAGLGVVAVRGV